MKAVLCLPKFKTVGYIATNGEIGSSLTTTKKVCDVRAVVYVAVSNFIRSTANLSQRKRKCSSSSTSYIDPEKNSSTMRKWQ